MPKYRGRVDCYISPSADGTGNVSSRMCSELFCNVVQHLSQSGPELGVEMIAANYGIQAGSIGTGFDFWDQSNPPGHRAWAVFRFHSASMGKFDMMVFVATGSSVSFSPMNVATNASSFAFSSRGNVGVAFATHPSGSNTGSQDGPWNGNYSLTSASIGASGSTISAQNPVWKLNDQGRGSFFPRANGVQATFSASRNYMSDLIEDNSITHTPLLAHIIITEDSFSVFCDQSQNGDYKITHFGPYVPRPGAVTMESPYFFMTNGAQGNAPWTLWPTGLGALAGSRIGVDAAIAHPDQLSGSRFASFMTLNVDSTIGYNQFINSGSYERFPIYAIISENIDQGIVGVVKHMTYGIGMQSNVVSTVSGTAAFGTTVASVNKILMPWSGSYPGSLTGVRAGRLMSFNT